MSDPSKDDLESRLFQEAQSFALRLSDTVCGALGDKVPPFVARTAPETSRLAVRQDPRTGIVLTVGGVPRLRLTVDMWCTWDHAEAFLAVDESQIVVNAAAGSSEPLFRYEYFRLPTGAQAGAHLQIHAHRDTLSYLMAICGEGSRRGRRRRRAAEGNDRVPQLSDLHFPLGGPRYRPCLGDVLQMLIDEFGVDTQPDAHARLEAGRERWRLDQLAASVRDSPRTAARALQDMGYEVAPPATGHLPDRSDRLHLL